MLVGLGQPSRDILCTDKTATRVWRTNCLFLAMTTPLDTVAVLSHGLFGRLNPQSAQSRRLKQAPRTPKRPNCSDLPLVSKCQFHPCLDVRPAPFSAIRAPRAMVARAVQALTTPPLSLAIVAFALQSLPAPLLVPLVVFFLSLRPSQPLSPPHSCRSLRQNRDFCELPLTKTLCNPPLARLQLTGASRPTPSSLFTTC